MDVVEAPWVKALKLLGVVVVVELKVTHSSHPNDGSAPGYGIIVTH